MTLLEFCKNFFPDKEIFVEHGETITVDFTRLLQLEQSGRDSGRISDYQTTPSQVLYLVEPEDWEHYYCRYPICSRVWYWKDPLVLSEESTQTMKRCQLVIDPEVAGIHFYARRPYFRMRGRPVTEEQAFDIIRRTDNFFRWDMDEYHLEGLVGNRFVLDNVWYSPNFHPHPRGWVRPNGVIGMNDITGTYPCEMEFVDSVLPLKIAFPFLDLMIGITHWNECPGYAWDARIGENGKVEDDNVYWREDYPDFLEHIVYGIWLHGDTIELMAPERAREKYAEYSRLYSGPDENIFMTDYYEDHNIHPADFEYLKRCIRSHGLDPEEVLASYKWGPKGLSRKRTEQGEGGPAQFFPSVGCSGI